MAKWISKLARGTIKPMTDWGSRINRFLGRSWKYDYTLFGPYGAGNIGDDAILESLLSRHFDVRRQRLAIITENKEATRRHIPNVHLSAREDRGAWKATVGKSSGVLLAGGTMISDFQGMGFPFGYSRPLLEFVQARRIPHAMMGVGANTVETQEGKDFFRRWYKDVALFAVRDDRCADVLHGLGIGQERIVIAADPVYGWHPSAELAPEMEALAGIVHAHPCAVAVNVTHEEWRGQASLYKAVARCCDRLAGELGAAIVYFASDCRPGDHYDAAAIQVAAGHMREQHVVLPCRNYKPSELAAFLSHFSVVLSMRMHPLILGALGGAIPAGIVRQPKMTRVLDEICPGPHVHAETATADEMFDQCRFRLADLSAMRLQLEKRLAVLAERELLNRRALEIVAGAAPAASGVS